MNISYGFHFGHDASGAALGAAGIQKFLNKERTSRIKHALALSTSDIRDVLKGAPDDAPIGFSSTQDVPVFFDAADVELSIDGGTGTSASEYARQIGQGHPYFRQVAWDKDFLSRSGILMSESQFHYETFSNERSNSSYEALGMSAPDNVLSLWHRKDGSLNLDGVKRSVTFYQHHLLHAYYAAYAVSRDKPALIITADGGAGPSFHGGGIYLWSPPGDLRPVVPIDGWLGEFYTTTSVILGLDAVGGPGKLMGLAPYGRPIHIDTKLVGTRKQVTLDGAISIPQLIHRWLDRCGVDVSDLANWDRWSKLPPGKVADIAASAQAIVELNMVELLRASMSIARRARHDYANIVLCGGLALNCPANSALSSLADVPVVVPPAVNDEGLSIGAAVAAWIDRYGSAPPGPATFADAVYLGPVSDSDTVKAAAARYDFRLAGSVDNMLSLAAQELERGQVMGLFSGRSEVGPRALGHRSIIADASKYENWTRVNEIKKREPWRPFAPAVLHDQASAFFDCGPAFSPYMLFNFRCSTKALPAVTHFDHTSRIQHVTPQTGLLHGLLCVWAERGHDPILMNTSFNGPGTPIVDTAEDAFKEARSIGLALILTDFGLFAAYDASVTS